MLWLSAKCPRPLGRWETAYERRFREPFKRAVILFGAMVEYHSISEKDQSRIHQFGQKVLAGIYLGYALCAEGIWKGDVLVADLEELRNLDASEKSMLESSMQKT